MLNVALNIAPNFAPISVVIPAYNAETFIAETIESVHAQTLQVAEIIVVDDGSIDNTATIAESLGARVIRQPNGGLPAARNAGIRAARQPWIALLDADDLWETEKIEQQWTAVQLHPDVGMISCDTSSFATRGVICRSFLSHHKTHYELANKTHLNEHIGYFPQVTENYFRAQIPHYPSAVMIRRDLLIAAGLFDESLRSKEDTECFLRVLAHCPLAIVERPLMRYRIHETNMSGNKLTMYLSSVEVAERIVADPKKYAQGAAQAYEKRLARLQIRAGRLLLEKERMREARPMFARSLKNQFALRPFYLWLSTWLSPQTFKRIKSLKRQLKSGKSATRK